MSEEARQREQAATAWDALPATLNARIVREARGVEREAVVPEGNDTKSHTDSRQVEFS